MNRSQKLGLALVGTTAALAGGILLWRRSGTLFLQDETSTNPRKLGFTVKTETSDRLIREVGMHFLSGFNTMLTCRRIRDFDRLGDQVYPLYRPFFYEGGAFAFFPKRYFAFWRTDQFERRIVARRPAFAPNDYMGAGHWFAHRFPRRPLQMARQLSSFDPVYRNFAYDGYGFKVGYFDYLRRPRYVDRLNLFDRELRHICFQGLGRAFRFVFADDDDQLRSAIGSLPVTHHRDLWIGWGHGIGQAGLENFARVFSREQAVPEQHRSAFRLGLNFAIWIRRANDADYFARRLSELSPELNSGVEHSLECCDEAHRAVRSDLRGHELFGENPLLAWQRLTAERLEGIEKGNAGQSPVSESNG